MGVTEEGYKKTLGFTQATTERAEPVRELLRDLIGRGLSFDNGILCVIDGSKGLRKAIGEVFGDRAEVQRVAQAEKCRQLPAEGRPENLANQAPASLPGNDLRGGQRAAYQSSR